MKPIHTYVLISTLTGMSACSGSNPLPEPDGPSHRIEYRVDVDSRATALYTDKSDISQFYVKAATDGGTRYIDCDLIKWDGARYSEADGFVRYWPAYGTRTAFFAFAGIEPDSVVFAPDNKGVNIPFTLAVDFDKQIDLIVANTGYESAPNGAEAAKSVSLEFCHALCQIEIRARNIDPAIDVEINGIGLKHIQNVGTLHADFSSAASAPFTWTLENVDDPTFDPSKPTYKILFDNAVAINGKVDSETYYLPARPEETYPTDPGYDKYIMMAIPQPVHAFDPATRIHGASLMLHANIWNVADDTGIHKSDDKKVWGLKSDDGEWMMIPISATWLPGRRYVYTIVFGGEGTNGGYEDDEENDDKDRVFDPIGFTVEIESWTAGGDIVQNIY